MPEYGPPVGFWNNNGVQWPLRPLTVVAAPQSMAAALCFDTEIAELPNAYHERAHSLAALQRGADRRIRLKPARWLRLRL